MSSTSVSGFTDAQSGANASLPAHAPDQDVVKHARRLIGTPRGRVRCGWHLGLTEGAVDETKAHDAFVYGDFRRVHGMGLIACHYRAAGSRGAIT